MKIIPRLSSLLCLAATAALKAQAPVPVQIASAKSVFLSNLGEEDNGISELAYSTLSAGLGQWGKYQIATAPASADLVLELHYQSLFDGQTVIGGGCLPPNHVPRLRLIILDRATMVPLWSVTEYPVQKSKTSLEQQYERLPLTC